jgi:hypothetical protein
LGVVCVEEVDCCEKLFGTKNDVMEVVLISEVNMEQIIEDFDMMISSGKFSKLIFVFFSTPKKIPLEMKHQEICILEEHSSFVACLVVSLAFLIHATYFPFVSTRKLFSTCHTASIFMVTTFRFEFEIFLISRGRRVT